MKLPSLFSKAEHEGKQLVGKHAAVLQSDTVSDLEWLWLMQVEIRIKHGIQIKRRAGRVVEE